MWSGIWRNYGWHIGSLLTPAYPNYLFSLSVIDNFFNTWKRSGIVNVKALYIGGIFPTFEQLQNKFNLPQSHSFRYLQVRSYITTNSPSFPNFPGETPIESLLSFDPFQKRCSFFYLLIFFKFT